ncbi:MAG: LysR family transcriptional regulator, partial [Mesorhizobium sp.]
GSCFASASAGDHASMAGLESFELPLPIPQFKISAMWHPRMDADPAHRWLRDTVMSACRAAYARR